MTAGMAYEAMKQCRRLELAADRHPHDNDMSIAPPVGALSGYLARLVSGRAYTSCATR